MPILYIFGIGAGLAVIALALVAAFLVVATAAAAYQSNDES